MTGSLCLSSSSFRICKSGVIPPRVMKATLMEKLSHPESSLSRSSRTLCCPGMFESRLTRKNSSDGCVASMKDVLRLSVSCLGSSMGLVLLFGLLPGYGKIPVLLRTAKTARTRDLYQACERSSNTLKNGSYLAPLGKSTTPMVFRIMVISSRMEMFLM